MNVCALTPLRLQTCPVDCHQEEEMVGFIGAVGGEVATQMESMRSTLLWMAKKKQCLNTTGTSE